uniref:Kazal-like domain-containing protein n=1 Tax=Panagrellus redivivus TaxID=6233 RepID=A0A7E4VUB0_PANRE
MPLPTSKKDQSCHCLILLVSPQRRFTMPESPTSPFMINMSDVHVVSDRFCTQHTFSVEPYRPGLRELPTKNCKYEVLDNCEGTKIVNVKCGPDTYKCHDGCLRKISFKLGKMADYTNDITIESRFDPVIVKKALIHPATLTEQKVLKSRLPVSNCVACFFVHLML